MTIGLGRGGWAGVLGIVTAANLAAQAVPAQLGVSEQEAQQSFVVSIMAGSPQWGVAGAAFVALPTAARVAVVQGAFAWARAYVKSQSLRTAYVQAREASKPRAPEVPGTVDDELRRQVADQLRGIEESRKALATLPPEQRKDMEATLKETEAQIRAPEYLAMLRTGIEAERVTARETYQADLKRWEEDYPPNPDLLVRRRLEAFLTGCGDVDFAATLQSQYGRMRFVDPEYESKSPHWKACYRAGREAVEAARTAAAAWLEAMP